MTSWKECKSSSNTAANCFLDITRTRAHNLPVGQYVKIAVTDTGIGMDLSLIHI